MRFCEICKDPIDSDSFKLSCGPACIFHLACMQRWHEEGGITCCRCIRPLSLHDLKRTNHPLLADLCGLFTALAERGNLSVIDEMIANRVDLNSVNADGNSAIIAMCAFGHLAIVHKMLNAYPPVNVDAKDNQDNTALLMALENGHTATAELLIEAGADLDVENVDGNTALLVALEKGHTAIAELLIEAGADASPTEDDGKSPEDADAERVAFDMMLDHRKKLPAEEGRRHLIWAVKHNAIDSVVKLLCKFDVNPNTIDPAGMTVLMLAASYNHVDIGIMLLRAGANPTASNGGMTAASMARGKLKAEIQHQINDWTRAVPSFSDDTGLYDETDF
jgi:hypothetical protein